LNAEDKTLLAKLVLRRQLFLQENGGEPNLSDEALIAMAQLKPVTHDDFMSLPGVGPARAKKYAAGYINTIKSFYSGTPVYREQGSARAVLGALEQQLIGINLKNRLLHGGVLRPRVAIDMTQIASADKIADLLSGSKRIIITPTLGATRKNKGRYEMLTDLMRENQRGMRETGSNDVYIGWPYVQGRITGSDFLFCAPLAFFPVSMTRTAEEFTLEYDHSRAPLYNNNLLVAVNKLHGKMVATFDNAIDGEFDFKKLFSYYKLNGVSIAPCESEIVPYVCDDKALVKLRSLSAVGYCVLGRFAQKSTSIHRDFDAIVSGKAIPQTVLELVENVGKEDLVAKLEAMPVTVDSSPVSERELYYVNDLNAAQERVVTKMRTVDHLVVSGPPGTGKSQVITGVIADFVMRGKNVLMVSEKKAALDVVRSRLGKLNDYCLQVDDAEDKEAFYGQILAMFDRMEETPEGKVDPALSDEVEYCIERLSHIAHALYDGESSMAEIYRKADCPDLENAAKRRIWEDVKASGFDPSSIEPRAFEELSDRLSNRRISQALAKWIPILTSTPIVTAVARDLMRADTGAFLSEAKESTKALQRAAILPGLKRRRALGEVERRLRPVLERIFARRRIGKKLYQTACASLDTLIEVCADYEWFTQTLNLLDGLNEVERAYAQALFTLREQWGCGVEVAAARLASFYYVYRIDAWETEHRDVLREMNDFNALVDDMARAMEQKRTATVATAYRKLSEAFRNIKISKRFGDMRRIADGARKSSIVRFLQRFDNELFLGIKIWLMTPEMVSAILPLREGMFDLVLFDEASQMYVERAIPSVVRGKKILVAGDGKQLRPSALGSGRMGVDEEYLYEEGIESTALEVESFLDLAESKYERIMLDAHYRSTYSELIAFSNFAFYKGSLIVSPNVRPPLAPPIEVVYVKDGVWTKRTNEPEAARVVKLIRHVLKTKGSATVGVITFNSSQRNLIEKLIDAECAKDKAFANAYLREESRVENGEDVGLFIKNIENVQGDERDIIIFSMGYAKDEKGRFNRQFGWLSAAHGENRLNVAVTRAKSKIYFVTSMKSGEFAVDDLDSVGPRILKKYIAYAEAVSAGNDELARTVLGSLSSGEAVSRHVDDAYLDKLEKKLKAKKLQVRRDVGVGNTVIDLAVTTHDGRVIGYESDLALYKAFPDARYRDYHRRKYLQSRGWEVRRVWSPEVYHDPNKGL